MKKSIIIVLVIIALAFTVRAFKITQTPLYGDELTAVLDANSILKTGMDETGKVFPVTFPMRGGSPPGYIYASIPFVWLFGPNTLGIRAASLVSGILIVFLMYLIVKKLFGEREALSAAFLMAVSPWGINLSRGGFETNLALAFSLAGVTLFLYSAKKPLNWIFGAICFGLAIFTYSTFKLLIPLFLPILFWYLGGVKFFFSKKKLNYSIPTVLVFVLFGGLLVSQVLSNNSERRFLSANIFSQQDLKETIVQKINFERSIDTLGIPSIIFHNKAVEYFNVLKDNYLSHFSIYFLFISGDGNPRHNMTQAGEFYLAELLLLIAGIIYLAKKNGHQKEILLIIVWVLIGPLASALLGEQHALRSSFMLPPILLINSVGAIYLIQNSKKLMGKILFIIISVIFLIQFIFLVERLYFVSLNKFANFWSYPAKKATEVAIENSSSYDYIFISSRINDSEYAYPIYAKVNPREVISQNLERQQIGEYEFKKFGNVYIGDIVTTRALSFLTSLKGSVLFVGDYLNDREGLDPYQDIFAPDDTRILVVRRINGN